MEHEHVWKVTGEGIEGVHCNILVGPDNKATVQNGGDGWETKVGKKTLSGGETLDVKLPVTVEFGTGKVKIRAAKKLVDVEFMCKRHHVDRRRRMRKFESGKDYADRQLVVPTVGNSAHYGSS